MIMSGKREKKKDDTWGEKELSKHIGKGTSSKKPATYGSPKTQPKGRGSSRDATGSKPNAGQATSSPSTSRRSDPKASSSHVRGRDKGPKSSLESNKKHNPQASSKSGVKDHPTTAARGSSRDHRTDGPQSRRTDKSGSSQARKEGRGSSDPRQKTEDSRRSSDKRRTQPDDPRSSRGRGDRSGTKQNSRNEKSSDRHRSSKERESGASKGRDGSKDKHRSNPERHKKKDDKRDDSKSKIVVREDPPSHKAPQEAVPQELEEEKEESGSSGLGGDNYEGNFPQQMVEVTEDLAVDEYEYEDEFEEYDEDFEEELDDEDDDSVSEQSESEEETPAIINKQSATDTGKGGKVDLVEIMQAIDAENQSIGTSSQTQLVEMEHHEKEELEGGHTPQRHHDHVGRSPSRRFVDFSSAQRLEVDKKVARKARKRGQELLSMIELDIVTFDLFDLPPLSEYEVYVKKFGADDTRQVSVQTGEDNVECNSQTDPIVTVDKWVQWPPEDLRGYGGGTPGEHDENEEYSSSRLLGESALHLVSFLKNAGQVCSVLLEENLSESGQSQSQYTQSQFPFCSTKLQIQPTASILSGRHVRWAHVSPTQEHLLLAAYSPGPAVADSQQPHHVSKGLVCLWNTREPTKPHMVLGCESTPTCCCLSPLKSSVAFAGNEDGSVVLWDLREPLSMHKSPGSETSEEMTVRVPTFSTAGIPQLNNHQAPIVSITPLSAGITDSATSTPSLPLFSGESEEGTTSGLSFQLVTLDSSCRLNIWVLVELPSPDPHGSESDLGLVPGGRVKLVKSASIDITSPPPTRLIARSSNPPESLMQAHCLQFQPQDTNHIYIGTDTGCVYHHTRYGRRPIPRCYLPSSNTKVAPCEVLSLSFSQRQPDHFLAGCSDGSLRLHHTKRAPPLLSWPTSTGSVAVVCVQWVRHCPGVFLVQDSESTLYMWDLVQNDAEPVFKVTLKTRLSSSYLHKSTVPTLTLAFTDGTLEIHQLKELPQSNANREQSFEDYFKSLQ